MRIGSRRLLEIQRSVDAVQFLGLAAIAIPIWILMANGEFSNIQVGDLWKLANRLSALLATSLLLIHILLVSRAPWLERTLGLDKLTHAHKKLGKPLIYLLLLHTLLATIDFATVDGIGLFEAFTFLNLHYQEVLLATAGLLLMIAVVVSSIRAARKRLSYESWYLIHITSYLAILAAIPHQLELGTDFLGQPLIKSYFTLLYVLVAANLIWFRTLQPLVMSLSANLKVVEVKPEANRTTSIVIGGRKVERFGAEAGQFFLLRVLTAKQWWRPHPFSVSNSPANVIRFTVGNRGDDTSALQDIQVGTRVVLEGPYGVFTESKRTKQHITLLAAGIGVAPIRALAESLAAEPGDITVIYRATDASDAALLDEVKRICVERGHNLHVLEGPRPQHQGFLPVPEKSDEGKPEHVRLLSLSPMLLDSDIYICGPTQWSNSAKHSLEKLGIKKAQIHLEEFAW